MKKAYTYDLRGDIIPIKGVNVDHLPRECNFELRYNTRKAAVSTKGLFSFDKLSLKAEKL
jgi:hypothetical protein